MASALEQSSSSSASPPASHSSPPPPPPPPPPREGPSWLPHFLTGNYFSQCLKHASSKNERNHFCIDCVLDGPMCHIGLQTEHANHRSLQVRRASHMDAVRVHDIQKLADISNIQTYTINSAKIVFLLSRPQDRIAKAATHWCQNCNRTLTDPTCFCSISCKLAAARINHSVSLALPLHVPVPSHGELSQHAPGTAASSSPGPVPVPAGVAASSSPGPRTSRTCCFEDEPVLVKSMAVEGLTDEQKMSKAGKKAQVPIKKRKMDSPRQQSSTTVESDGDEEQATFADVPPSPISVLVPHSPQHSGISSLAADVNNTVEPLTPQKHCESPRSSKQRRKGQPQRSPLS